MLLHDGKQAVLGRSAEAEVARTVELALSAELARERKSRMEKECLLSEVMQQGRSTKLALEAARAGWQHSVGVAKSIQEKLKQQETEIAALRAHISRQTTFVQAEYENQLREAAQCSIQIRSDCAKQLMESERAKLALQDEVSRSRPLIAHLQASLEEAQDEIARAQATASEQTLEAEALKRDLNIRARQAVRHQLFTERLSNAIRELAERATATYAEMAADLHSSVLKISAALEADLGPFEMYLDANEDEATAENISWIAHSLQLEFITEYEAFQSSTHSQESKSSSSTEIATSVAKLGNVLRKLNRSRKWIAGVGRILHESATTSARRRSDCQAKTEFHLWESPRSSQDLPRREASPGTTGSFQIYTTSTPVTCAIAAQAANYMSHIQRVVDHSPPACHLAKHPHMDTASNAERSAVREEVRKIVREMVVSGELKGGKDQNELSDHDAAVVSLSVSEQRNPPRNTSVESTSPALETSVGASKPDTLAGNMVPITQNSQAQNRKALFVDLLSTQSSDDTNDPESPITSKVGEEPGHQRKLAENKVMTPSEIHPDPDTRDEEGNTERVLDDDCSDVPRFMRTSVRGTKKKRRSKSFTNAQEQPMKSAHSKHTNTHVAASPLGEPRYSAKTRSTSSRDFAQATMSTVSAKYLAHLKAAIEDEQSHSHKQGGASGTAEWGLRQARRLALNLEKDRGHNMRYVYRMLEG